MGLFTSINTAFQGLDITQKQMGIVSQNVAGANSAGYVKRRLLTADLAGPGGGVVSNGVQRLLVGVHHEIGKTGGLGMQAPAAQVFGVNLFLDRQRGEQRARHRQHGALADDAEIREHRIPGRRAIGVAQSGRCPGRFPCPLVLRAIVAQQRAHAARAHGVGHARA